MLQNSSIVQIAEVFFNEPTKQHYLIEISKKSKLAHTSAKKYILALKKDGIIKKNIEKRGKRNFPSYIANLENPRYKLNKRIFNISKVLDSGLVEFLRDKLMPKTIILFGSYSRGEDIEDPA